MSDHRTEPRRCVCGGDGKLEFDGETVTTWCPRCGRKVLPKLFPLLYSGRKEEQLRRRLPHVAWAFIVQHEAQAYDNHSQTLERLAERGGLSPAEMLCAIEGRSLSGLFYGSRTDEQRVEDEDRAVSKILALVEAWKASNP